MPGKTGRRGSCPGQADFAVRHAPAASDPVSPGHTAF